MPSIEVSAKINESIHESESKANCNLSKGNTMV